MSSVGTREGFAVAGTRSFIYFFARLGITFMMGTLFAVGVYFSFEAVLNLI